VWGNFATQGAKSDELFPEAEQNAKVSDRPSGRSPQYAPAEGRLADQAPWARPEMSRMLGATNGSGCEHRVAQPIHPP
jgi:hypothetical protein